MTLRLRSPQTGGYRMYQAWKSPRGHWILRGRDRLHDWMSTVRVGTTLLARHTDGSVCYHVPALREAGGRLEVA